MDANELGRWTRFAARGGIGKCTAVEDCIAEAPEDLMFMKDDDIIVLMQVQEPEGRYLGYCEGIVGYFRGDHVRFHAKLKKAVMTKRSSVVSAKSPTPDGGATTPRSPPAKLPNLPPTTSRHGSPHFNAAGSLSRSGSISTEKLHVVISPTDMSPASSSTLSLMGGLRTSFASGQISAMSSETALTTPSPVVPSGDSRDHKPTDLQRVSSQSGTIHNSKVKPNGAEAVDPGNMNDADSTQDDTTSSSLFGLHERTYEDSEHGHRESRALSDGKLGIGLSLLQDLVNGIEDDWSETEEEGFSAPNPAIVAQDSQSRGNGVHHKSMTATSDIKFNVAEPRGRASSSGPSSPSSIQPSHSDWEGASDIYDDYRYSRHSIASKLSRYSQNSGDFPNNSSSNAPPLPRDPKDSVERKRSTDSHWLDPISSSHVTDKPETTREPTFSQKVPAASDISSATITKDQIDFPLIGATFASPPNSPESKSSESIFISPPLPLAPLPQTTLGPSLRQKLKSGRGSPIAPNTLIQPSSEVEAENRRIIVEDKEVGPSQKSANDNELNREPSSRSSSPDIDTTLFPGPLRIVNRTPSPASSIVNPPEKEQGQEGHNSDVYQTSSACLPPPATAPLQSSQPPSASLRTPQATTPAMQNGSSPRRSLFLPHPNAPKPAPVPSEPMYIRRTSGQQASDPTRVLENTAMHAVRMAASSQRGLANRTIYGRCNTDLANSSGPVPISFSLDPPAVPLHSKQSLRSFSGSMVVNGPSIGPSIPPLQSADLSSTPLTSANAPSFPERNVSAPTSLTRNASAQPDRPAPTTLAKPAVVLPPGNSEATSAGNVIPRPNFVPKIQTARPRSRSFSGFETVPLGTTSVKKPDEPVVKPHRSKTSSSSFTTPSKPQAFGGGVKSPTSRIHAPSPLSLPQNNSVVILSTKNTLQSPTSSSPSSFSPLAPSFSSNDRISMQPTIRHAQSSMTLNEGSLLTSRYRPALTKHTPAENDSSVSPSSTSSKSSLPASMPALPLRNKTDPAGLTSGRRSTDMNVSRNADTRSFASSSIGVTTSSASVGRIPSLKSKLSLPNLRGKNVGRIRQDDALNMATGSAGQDIVLDNETVQVKDMDFELIRPIIPRVSTSRSSEDSIATVQSGSFDLKQPDIPGNRLRADSPISMSSAGGSSLRSPTTSEGPWHKNTKGPDSETSMDAHRQRELKWVSVMSSIPSSQARKSKKVKKLLLEGVPSSVRFLVWAHLTDSKARGVPGVYSQLGQRVRVSAYQDVRRDVQRCFADQPQLQSTHDSLLTLLSTYMTMVPDILYHRGMAFVAAHLLLLSPEEDAFWIFVSMMDAHLRPYFSTSSVQVEVDALLFSKALEAHDPPLSKKIFFNLGVKPTSLCKPWFGCVFAQSLPSEHLRRVWDLFLYEGLPFLIRVGLVLISCCRRQLFHANSGEFVLRHLRHLPAITIPTDPEAFLSLVFSVKIKDDDIRKQRIKMEAQIKRQAQQRMAQS